MCLLALHVAVPAVLRKVARGRGCDAGTPLVPEGVGEERGTPAQQVAPEAVSHFMGWQRELPPRDRSSSFAPERSQGPDAETILKTWRGSLSVAELTNLIAAFKDPPTV